VFLASENIDFTGLAHVFLLGGGELTSSFFHHIYKYLLIITTPKRRGMLSPYKGIVLR
jgi:hypothetical protein